MALSEPILPSFATFASPCRERGFQEVRNPITVTGMAAAGNLPDQTNPGTTENTRGTGPSSATSVTEPFPGLTTWLCT
uniref:Uncharacterized protein n=1 Tax=Monodelphis domestica TaxID=13616 RepID=A0A5F8G785_MONDO